MAPPPMAPMTWPMTPWIMFITPWSAWLLSLSPGVPIIAEKMLALDLPSDGDLLVGAEPGADLTDLAGRVLLPTGPGR